MNNLPYLKQNTRGGIVWSTSKSRDIAAQSNNREVYPRCYIIISTRKGHNSSKYYLYKENYESCQQVLTYTNLSLLLDLFYQGYSHHMALKISGFRNFCLYHKIVNNSRKGGGGRVTSVEVQDVTGKYTNDS